MHGKYMPYIAVAGVALVGGLLLAGTPVSSLFPFLLLLACPLMMVFMMRGMHGGHDTHNHTHPNTNSEMERPRATDPTIRPR